MRMIFSIPFHFIPFRSFFHSIPLRSIDAIKRKRRALRAINASSDASLCIGPIERNGMIVELERNGMNETGRSDLRNVGGGGEGPRGPGE